MQVCVVKILQKSLRLLLYCMLTCGFVFSCLFICKLGLDDECCYILRDDYLNNNIQNTTQKSKLRWNNTNATENWGGPMCSGRAGSTCSTRATRCVTLVTNPVICHE